MAYNIKYTADFCSISGKAIEVKIYKREAVASSAPPLVISMGASPFKITTKDAEDNPLKPINGSEAVINLLSSAGLSAGAITANDEREWLTEIFYGGSLYWKGYHLPESLSEPFSYGPSEIRIKATDVIGNLDKIPYKSDFSVYTGFASQKDVIVRCLAATGLDLNMLIGINTFEAQMATNTCPLQQAEINQSRFLDQNNSPWSCLDVLTSVLTSYGAKIRQSFGKWYITSALEEATGPVKYWEFDPSGAPLGYQIIESSISIGGTSDNAPILGESHQITTARALLNATAYYQYGFMSNAVRNGDFNDFYTPLILPVGWEAKGGVDASTGVSKITDETTGVEKTTGYFLIVKRALVEIGQMVECAAPMAVRSNQLVTVSFEMVVPGGRVPGRYYLELVIRDTAGNYLANSGWESTGAPYEILYSEADLMKGVMTVSFEIPPRGHDYLFYFAFGQVRRKGSSNVYETHFDNLNIQVQTSDAVLTPAVGRFIRLTQPKSLTATLDPSVIYHGDEPDDLRTSQIRVNGAATSRWKRNGIAESEPLLYTIADTVLRLNSRPKKILNFQLASTRIISPTSVYTVRDLPGRYVLLNGDFDPFNESYDVVLCEALTAPVDIFTPYDNREDYGLEKDKDGKSVGTPGGTISPPPSSVSAEGFVRKWEVWADDLDVTGTLTAPVGKFSTQLVVPLVAATGVGSTWMVDASGGSTPTPPEPGGATRFSELLDVALSGLVNRDVALYDSATSKWVNRSTAPWDAAATDRHTHANKSVLDSISTQMISEWNAAYSWGNHAGKYYTLGSTVANSTKWNDNIYVGSVQPVNQYLMGYQGGNAWGPVDKAGLKNFIGLPPDNLGFDLQGVTMRGNSTPYELISSNGTVIASLGYSSFSAYIGALSSHDLDFYAGGVVRATLTKTGQFNVSGAGIFDNGSRVLSARGNSNGFYVADNYINFGSQPAGLYWGGLGDIEFSYNSSTLYGVLRIGGSKGGYSGIYDVYSGVTYGMFDAGGNGGVYRKSAENWQTYWHEGNGCLSIAGTATEARYGAYINKGAKVAGVLNIPTSAPSSPQIGDTWMINV